MFVELCSVFFVYQVQWRENLAIDECKNPTSGTVALKYSPLGAKATLSLQMTIIFVVVVNFINLLHVIV